MLSTGVILPREIWSHIAIQLDSDSQTVVVYVDGTQVYSSSISGSVPLASSLTTPSSKMSIILNEESISGKKKIENDKLYLYVIQMRQICITIIFWLYTGYTISGYHVEFTTLSDAEVATLSSACHILRPSAFISMDTIANLSQIQPTSTFLTPSVCDSMWKIFYTFHLN